MPADALEIQPIIGLDARVDRRVKLRGTPHPVQPDHCRFFICQQSFAKRFAHQRRLGMKVDLVAAEIQ